MNSIKSPYDNQQEIHRRITNFQISNPGLNPDSKNPKSNTHGKISGGFIPQYETVGLNENVQYNVYNINNAPSYKPSSNKKITVDKFKKYENDADVVKLDMIQKKPDLSAVNIKKLSIADEKPQLFSSQLFNIEIPEDPHQKNDPYDDIVPIAEEDEEQANKVSYMDLKNMKKTKSDAQANQISYLDLKNRQKDDFFPTPDESIPVKPTKIQDDNQATNNNGYLDIKSGNNNWCIQSFVPTPATKPDANWKIKSISFIGVDNKFTTMHNQLKRAKIRFIDKDFPPEFKSLWGFGECNSYNKSEWKGFKWATPKEIFKGEEFYVYEDKIDPDDILQGGLGDCYFLSAIAGLAEYPDRIKKLFLTRHVNDEGIYCIALCINGLWEEVIMDDQVPTMQYSRSPAFNHSRGNELWVILLEKAWAKVHGGYLNINSGLTREALHDLTGAPCITYFNDEGTETERWNLIYNAVGDKFILASGTADLMGNGRDDQEKTTGIVGSHAYSILGAVE